uniref:Uncharacterized protein n=1 Tax=Glossina austeni TaxID=7395 RepID=A0A1A9V5J8_GLOAU
MLDLKLESMERVEKIRGDKQFSIKSKKGDNRKQKPNQFTKSRIVLSDALEEGVVQHCVERLLSEVLGGMATQAEIILKFIWNSERRGGTGYIDYFSETVLKYSSISQHNS